MRIRLFTILILSLLSLASLTLRAGDYDALYKDLPVQMEQPRLPSIPELSVSISEFGACGDGVTLNTEAFSKAVSKLAKQGGGHLIVPPGMYLTGPIVLKDRIDLHLEKGAYILFSPDKSLFVKDGKRAQFLQDSLAVARMGL